MASANAKKGAGNMTSKLWISFARMGNFLVCIAVMIISSGQASAARSDETISPSTVLMNESLFKNLSESFSQKELDHATVSLNRSKRQSLNLQQLALLAGLNNAGVNANPVPAAVGLNTSNNGAAKQTTEGKHFKDFNEISFSKKDPKYMVTNKVHICLQHKVNHNYLHNKIKDKLV